MKSKAACLAAMGLLCLQVAHADPADYIFTPTVEEGEKEIDFKFGSADSDPHKSVAKLGMGYGATSWWFTEAYVSYVKLGGGDFKYDAFEWENKFQLTETGKYPVDVGLITELEIPRAGDEGKEFKFGPLLQTEVGKWQLNGNVLFEKHFDADTPAPTALQYQWQAKYRWQPSFEIGAQGFGDMGKWNDWATRDQQLHRLGPAVFGKVPLGNRTAIKYNVAWLAGLTKSTPDNTLRMQLEFEF